MHTFIENYLHFMKNCIRPHYEKLNPLKSGFIENSKFESNRDPWSMQDPAGLGEDPNRTIPDVNTNYSNIWSGEVDM